MGNCSTNCNPCGPDYNAINQLATQTAAYARQAKTSEVNAENAWLEFNALYLGAFAVAPTVDNEGNALQVGALYFNTVTNGLFSWNGSVWITESNFNELTPFLATGTTTSRNLATRFADVVNLKDFGTPITDASIASAISAAVSQNKVIGVDESITVKIPTSAATLQIALDRLTPLTKQVIITLQIQTGHSLTSGISLNDRDCSQFVITSIDAEVPISFNTDIINGINSKMPKLSCLINAISQTSGDGIDLKNSSMKIDVNCGIKNSWGNGLLAYGGSIVDATGTIWTGSARNNTTASGITSWGSLVFASNANVSNSMFYGAQAAHGGILVIDNGTANNCFRYNLRATDAGWMSADGVTSNYAGCDPSTNLPYASATAEGIGIYSFNGSFISARDASAIYAKRAGILATNGSTIQALSGLFNNAGESGAHASNGSSIILNGANLNNCSQFGIYSINNSFFSAQDSTINNCNGYGVYSLSSKGDLKQCQINNCTGTAALLASEESSINAQQISITTASGSGVFITANSSCNIASSTITNSGNIAVYCSASNINADSVVATGAANKGLECTRGGKVNAVLSNFQKGGSPSATDIVVSNGGIISANLSTGGLSQTQNTITASGIIFR